MKRSQLRQIIREQIKHVLNEKTKINTKEEFAEYVTKFLKNAHGDDFDESIANKMIADLIKRVENDKLTWGQAVGIVQNG